MTFKSLSKFCAFSGQYTQNQNLNYICSMHFRSIHHVKPINMAFTAFETISPEGQNDIPILILHGALGSKANWNTMGRQIALKTARKVITLDLRNHGESPHTKEFSYEHVLADIKQLMAEMDLKGASLIGHSLGGRAMMAFALSFPHLVHDLVAVDISPVNISKKVRQFPDILSAMKNIKLSSSELSLLKARIEADEQLKTTIKDKSVRDFLLLNLAFDEKQKKFYWKVNIQALIEKMHKFIDFPFNGVFVKPTLFIAGAKSDFMKKEDEPLILKKFPKARFEYVKNSGHMVHVEKPAVFLDIVSSFLEEKNLQSSISSK